MVNILQSKRESSRFQILVEIAAHQPNLRQKEVAERLGVTPQAISEYIKELVANGLSHHGRPDALQHHQGRRRVALGGCR